MLACETKVSCYPHVYNKGKHVSSICKMLKQPWIMLWLQVKKNTRHIVLFWFFIRPPPRYKMKQINTKKDFNLKISWISTLTSEWSLCYPLIGSITFCAVVRFSWVTGQINTMDRQNLKRNLSFWDDWLSIWNGQ